MAESHPRNKPIPRWARVLLSLVVGVFITYLDYRSRNFEAFELANLQESLARGLLAAVASALLAEIWSFKADFSDLLVKNAELAAELKEIKGHILGDERIIFARPHLGRDGRSIAILGIESVDPVPEALSYFPQTAPKLRRWERSISILRFDRIQDLLFSREYLQHFFALRKNAKRLSRILVINDSPRSRDAIRSFLQISKNTDVNTYVYLKSEYYAMLSHIPDIVPADHAAAVQEILTGNPELNIMVKAPTDFRVTESNPLSLSNDYVLRYLTTGRREIVTRAPGPLGREVGTLPGQQVGWVYQLMDAALRYPRLGPDAFDRIVSANGAAPENFWSSRNLQRLKGTVNEDSAEHFGHGRVPGSRSSSRRGV